MGSTLAVPSLHSIWKQLIFQPIFSWFSAVCLHFCQLFIYNEMRDLFGDFQTLCSNSAWKKCTFFFFPSEEEESETTPKKKLKSSRRKKKIAFSLKVQRRAETLTGGYLENTASEDAAATVYTKANIEINLSPTITTSRKETFSMAMAHNCALGNNNRKSIRGKEKKGPRFLDFGHPSNCLEVPWEIFVPHLYSKVSCHFRKDILPEKKKKGLFLLQCIFWGWLWLLSYLELEKALNIQLESSWAWRCTISGS